MNKIEIFGFLIILVAGIFFTSNADAALLPFSDIKVGGKSGTGCWDISVTGYPAFSCSTTNKTLHITHGTGITIKSFSGNQTIWVNGTGSQGPQGPQGIQGIPGNNGSNGTNGRNGTNGTNGTNGATGPQGPRGFNGTNGKNGTDATSIYDTMQNLGGGTNIYFGNNTKTNFQFNTLAAIGASSLSTNSNLVTIYTHTFQNNTGTSLGTHGTDIYSGMSGSVLQFPKLLSGNSNCIWSGNSTNDIITCTENSPVHAINAGSGISVNGTTGTVIVTNTGVKSLTVVGSGSGNATTGNILLTTKTYQNNTGTNLGTSGSGVYSSMSGSALQFLKLISANNNCSFSTNSTNVIITCSDTNTAQVVNADNGESLISSKFNATETKLMTLRNQSAYLLLNHNNTSISPSFQFKVNNVACGVGTALTATNNSTGASTCTAFGSGSGSVTSSQNVGRASGSVGVLSTPTSTVIKGRNMTGTSPITVTRTNDTDIAIACATCLTSTAGGTTNILAANVTSASTTAFTHVWNIALTANSGNRISGVLIAASNTAGGAVQVGANMSSIAHGQGVCQFTYDSAGTTITTFASVLTAASSDSAWTTILAGANQPYPINFDCTVDTDASPPTLQINFQAEVASTVSIKAGSSYLKTP